MTKYNDSEWIVNDSGFINFYKSFLKNETIKNLSQACFLPLYDNCLGLFIIHASSFCEFTFTIRCLEIVIAYRRINGPVTVVWNSLLRSKNGRFPFKREFVPWSHVSTEKWFILCFYSISQFFFFKSRTINEKYFVENVHRSYIYLFFSEILYMIIIPIIRV